MLFYGTDDTVISLQNVADFQQNLDAASVENEVLEIPGGRHLPVQSNRTALLQSLKFLDGQLK